MVDAMNMSFDQKAESLVAGVGTFPKMTHPLWKGFPQNQWKKAIESLDWGSSAKEATPFEQNALTQLPFETWNQSVLLLQNGSISWLQNENKKIQFRLNERFQIPNLLEDHQEDSFHKLTNEMSVPGFELEIPEGLILERPLVCLVNVADDGHWQIFNHQIRIGKRARATILFVQVGDQKNQGACAHIVTSSLGRNSQLGFARLSVSDASENSYFRSQFLLGQESELEFVDIAAGGKISRSETFVRLEEDLARASVSAMHLLKDHQVYDSRVCMIHQAPDTYSRQLVKSVVADHAHSLFGGTIVIEKNSQRVDSSQSHKALLISEKAKSSAFPELEVHADDVKAAHGSSTGRMDQEQMFYLKSRGLTEKEAVHLLSEAFVKDVVLKQNNPQLKVALEQTLNHILPQFIEQMESRWSV